MQSIHMTMYALAILCLTAAAGAEIQTRTITYHDGDTVLQGYLAYDDAKVGAGAPGVLIVHQWMGLTDYEQRRARELAELGYVAFALDIYGKANRPANRGEAGAQAGKYKSDRDLFRRRLHLGLEQLKKQPGVDKTRLAAIGYCFGGTGVLELARSGADIKGVVSFHGGLDSPNHEDGGNIKARVLICHGADDPHVSREGIEAMIKEFNDAEVDWQMIYYADAVHSFTQPMAGNDPSRGSAYNQKADQRSWQHMRVFFEEIFE